MLPWYKIFKWFYPDFHWEIPTREKVIYLTFDDGPIPEVTPWVLEQLRQFESKATFFCIGDNIRKYPQLLNQIMQAGHTVGNHTYNHLKGWSTNVDDYLNNFQEFEKNTKTSLFRPPYGRLKRKQAKEILKTHKIIMWSVLTMDYSPDISPEKCLERAIRGTKSGSIVVFHDSIKAEKNLRYALPKFLKYLDEKGYRFGVIPH